MLRGAGSAGCCWVLPQPRRTTRHTACRATPHAGLVLDTHVRAASRKL
jgi:hypothetical protein